MRVARGQPVPPSRPGSCSPRHEPVPLRRGGPAGPVCLLDAARALPPAAVGTVARPLRPAGRGAAPRRRRPAPGSPGVHRGVAERVAEARARAHPGVGANAELGARALDDVAPLSDGAALIVESRPRRSGRLSARGSSGWRVALTLSDLWGRSAPLQSDQVSLALSLRRAEPVGLGRLTPPTPHPRPRRRACDAAGHGPGPVGRAGPHVAARRGVGAVADGTAVDEPAAARPRHGGGGLPGAWAAAAPAHRPRCRAGGPRGGRRGRERPRRRTYPGARQATRSRRSVVPPGRLGASTAPVATVGTRGARPTAGRSPATWAETSPRRRGGWCPVWHLGIDGAAHRRAAGRSVPRSSGGGQRHDVKNPAATETCGSGSPPRGCSCPRRRSARHRTVALPVPQPPQALADAVVVVESRRSGGCSTRSTPRWNGRCRCSRCRDRSAVRHRRAPTTCWGLLCQCAADVLTPARPLGGGVEPGPGGSPAAHGRRPRGARRWVAGPRPRAAAVRSGLGLADLAAAAAPRGCGWVTADGGWYEQVGRPDR